MPSEVSTETPFEDFHSVRKLSTDSIDEKMMVATLVHVNP